jgi:uncharacterized protein YcbX
MGTVAQLVRYPVKSMLGEVLSTARATQRGLDGDRIFAVRDRSGAVGSAKHPRKWGPLLRCRSHLSGAGAARVRLPDGTSLEAGSDELDDRLSELLGRPVTMSDQPDSGGVLERAVPEYAGGSPDGTPSEIDATGARITTGRVAAGTFFDFGALHLVTTTSLAELRTGYRSGDFDPRRFRPNLVIDTPQPGGFPEDAWVGMVLRIGDAVVRVTVPTPRCVIPTLAHDELPADPGIMRTVAATHRIPVLNLGALSCVGVYLDVLRPGVIRVGDPVAAMSP